MVDIDPFLTILYVMVEAFCKQQLAPEAPRPGPAAAWTQAEVVTLALFGQWQPFGSERGFDRSAQRHRRAAFPTLPERSQFNRLLRQHADAVVACFRHWGQCLQAQHGAAEALDGTAAPTRDAKRRGRGWLPGIAELGWSNRRGWYEGVDGLLSVSPIGAITGFGFGAASAQEQSLAETFLAVRHTPHPRLTSVGAPALGVYVTARGFEGRKRHPPWQDAYGAVVLCAPQRNRRPPWPRPWRRWLAGLGQLVETVNSSLQQGFRLDRERPHTLAGFPVRLAAKMALHNFCLWLNQQLGRPLLALMDLVA
jgi:hypothetical protein